MAALSPEKCLAGKKASWNICEVFSLRQSLALTPPAKTIDFVSGYFL